jgi:anti-sigma B factor antagonist
MRRGLDIEIVKWGLELRMSGRLDSRSSTAARLSLHEQVDGGAGDLTVDLAGTEIWDGAGLGVIVGTSRRARRAGRRLVLTQVSPREFRMLRVARVPRTAVVRPAPVPAG